LSTWNRRKVTPTPSSFWFLIFRTLDPILGLGLSRQAFQLWKAGKSLNANRLRCLGVLHQSELDEQLPRLEGSQRRPQANGVSLHLEKAEKKRKKRKGEQSISSILPTYPARLIGDLTLTHNYFGYLKYTYDQMTSLEVKSKQTRRTSRG
jgi:hypothetical protein